MTTGPKCQVHYIYEVLLFVWGVDTLYGASALHSIEYQRSLGDAAVQDTRLESAILFV